MPKSNAVVVPTLVKGTHNDECLEKARIEGWNEGYGNGIERALIAIDTISDRAYQAGHEDGREKRGAY